MLVRRRIDKLKLTVLVSFSFEKQQRSVFQR